MKNILFTHPNFLGIVEKIQERFTSPVISATSDYKKVLEMVEKGEVEKLGIVLDHTEISTLDLIQKVYKIDNSIPILVFDCNIDFKDVADYPELLEDNIFCLDSLELKEDSFFDVFEKFFSETLTIFDVEILEKTEN